VGVLSGNGDGTFQAAMTYGSGGTSANSVAVADLNGDRKPDIVVANHCADSNCVNGSVGVLLGNGAEHSRQPSATARAGCIPMPSYWGI